jgi:DNA repair photolyase
MLADISLIPTKHSMDYKRNFFSGKTSCPFGCLYCFADFEGFKKMELINFNEEQDTQNNVLIYYPSCDSEFIWTREFDLFIEKLFNSEQKAIISISTKARLKESILSKIKSINEILIPRKSGFIKLSVSFSTKSRIGEIEKGTLPYIQRIDQLRVFKEMGIPSSVILKPILPFIENEEYAEIINDTSDLTMYYLLGGLYLSNNSDFYKDYIEGRYTTVQKEADWLPYKPEWVFIESGEKIAALKNYIINKGKDVSLSDVELLRKIWQSLIGDQNLSGKNVAQS